MRQRTALILIALVPLLVATLGLSWVVKQRSQVLTELHVDAVQPVLLAARRDELQSFINLGRSAIAHLVRDGMPDAASQAQALDILRRLEFNYDGTFFVLDFDGRVLLYPRQPQWEGQNLASLQDSQGRFPVQQLLAQARAGGGYVELEWLRPSTGFAEPRLSYVVPIAGWEWVLGTGTYFDEPVRARKRISDVTEAAVADTLWRVGVIAVLCTLGAAAAAVLINVNEQRKADAQLRALAGALVNSQEEERARVARELHDGVSQSLVSAKYVFESAQDSARRAGASAEVLTGLQSGVDRLREVLIDLRRISHDLRPALLDDLGLPQALDHLTREWSQRSGVEVALDVPPTYVPASEALETALFRITQEALSNVEAHAEARRVELRLTRTPDALEWVMQDDGKGFDTERVSRSTPRGLGLSHMRERIEQLGGRFELSSSASGTWLRARFEAGALLT
jgi:two-component system, NarL family, sensor kinase